MKNYSVPLQKVVVLILEVQHPEGHFLQQLKVEINTTHCVLSVNFFLIFSTVKYDEITYN